MDISLFYQIPLTYWTQSYWRDEVFRIFLAKNNFVDIIKLTYNDGQPPLYYFLLKIWMYFFGDSEIATRTLSLIFFEILIFVFWRFLNTLNFHNRILKYFSLLVMIINSSLIYYAFEARVYILVVLLVTASNFFLWQKKYYWWLTVILLGLYTNNFVFFIVPFQFLWLLLTEMRVKLLLKYFALLSLLYFPWFLAFIHQSQLVQKEFWISKVGMETIKTGIAGIFFGFENDPMILNGRFFILSLILLPAFLFVGKNKPARFFALMFWGPLLTVLLISMVSRPIFLPRYLSFLVPTMILLLVFFLNKLSKKLSLPFMFLILFLSLQIQVELYTYRHKTDFRKAIRYLISRYRPGDAIYTTSLNFFETKYYFAKYAPKSYTDSVAIKLYSKNPNLPFYIGKVLINDEDVVSKIMADRKIFFLDQQGRIHTGPGFR